MKTYNNNAIAKIFDQIANILELRGKGPDKFRMLSYRKAAVTIESLPKDVSEYVIDDGQALEKIPGIGKGTESSILEYLDTGKMSSYEKYKKIFPQSLLDLMNIPSLGPKGVKEIHDTLGVTTMKQLKKVAEQGKIAELPRFGEKSQQNILEGIDRYLATEDKILLGAAYPIVKGLIADMKECKDVEHVEACGSFRRRKEIIGDIDLLATGKNLGAIIEYFVSMPSVAKVIARGDTKASVIIENSDRQVDLRVVEKDSFGSALQYFTGSKEHNVRLRTMAKEKGYKISEYGLFKGEKKVAGTKEEDIYTKLGLSSIPPEMREDRGEISAAKEKKVPDLVALKDIKGDLHMHSTWSDGKNSIEEMAQACQDLGYEYIAITDHSQYLKVANGLTVKELLKRNEEIKKVQEKFKIRILTGTEVDILPDGSLDYPDEVLEELDIVVASIHSRFSVDNTDRLLNAINNPHVDIIGHISGRLLMQRGPYPFDMEKVFDAAAQTKTAIEINASGKRLDISDVFAREAKDRGVKFTINTDAHHTDMLWQMDLGIGVAKRAWLTKEDILNTYSLEKLTNSIN